MWASIYTFSKPYALILPFNPKRRLVLQHCLWFQAWLQSSHLPLEAVLWSHLKWSTHRDAAQRRSLCSDCGSPRCVPLWVHLFPPSFPLCFQLFLTEHLGGEGTEGGLPAHLYIGLVSGTRRHRMHTWAEWPQLTEGLERSMSTIRTHLEEPQSLHKVRNPFFRFPGYCQYRPSLFTPLPAHLFLMGK